MLCGLLTIRGLLYCRRCRGTSFNRLCRSPIFCATRSKSCGFCCCHSCPRSKVSYAEHKLKATELDVRTVVEKRCAFPSCSTATYQAWAACATTALPWILKRTYKSSCNLNHKNKYVKAQDKHDKIFEQLQCFNSFISYRKVLEVITNIVKQVCMSYNKNTVKPVKLATCNS